MREPLRARYSTLRLLVRLALPVAALAFACGAPPTLDSAAPASGTPGSDAPRPGVAVPVECAVAAENQHPGSGAWLLSAPSLDREIEGYPLSVSSDRGEPVDIAVSTSVPTTYTWQVFRMGHYGGAQGRRMAGGGPLAGSPQAEPVVDPATQRVEARWPASFTIVPRDGDQPWPSGVYVVVLERRDGKQNRAIFVLRDDGRDADVTVKLSTATWQAYNAWGGISLYDDAPGQTRIGERALEVSSDRPYHPLLGYGTGKFQALELPLVSWLESKGYDVEYTTDADLGAERGAGVGGPRLFIGVGHDEYATRLALERLQEASRRGVNLAFLSGNTMYWAVRYEDTPAGLDRGIACYKGRTSEDPVFGVDDRHLTGRFRDAPLSFPENAVLGVMSNGDAIATPADWIVANPGHWIYAGTGVHEGDRIHELVFFEWDGLEANGQAPPNLEVLSHSPVFGNSGLSYQNAVTYEVAGTPPAFVFSAGTVYFARHLATNPVVEKMMVNVLDRAGAESCAATR